MDRIALGLHPAGNWESLRSESGMADRFAETLPDIVDPNEIKQERNLFIRRARERIAVAVQRGNAAVLRNWGTFVPRSRVRFLLAGKSAPRRARRAAAAAQALEAAGA